MTAQQATTLSTARLEKLARDPRTPFPVVLVVGRELDLRALGYTRNR